MKGYHKQRYFISPFVLNPYKYSEWITDEQGLFNKGALNISYMYDTGYTPMYSNNRLSLKKFKNIVLGEYFTRDIKNTAGRVRIRFKEIGLNAFIDIMDDRFIIYNGVSKNDHIIYKYLKNKFKNNCSRCGDYKLIQVIRNEKEM